MDGTQFLVQWDEHPSHLATRLGYLLEHQSLVDVTLMCNTHTLKVHRAVLAACSPYFERQLGNHPLIVLKDMKFSVLKSLVEFMYCGETSVSEENLTPLLEAAKFFEVKGLSSMTKETVCSPSTSHSSKAFNGTATPTTSGYGRVGTSASTRGRGRGRGRPPLNPTAKIGSPTESAQILLSLSGGSIPTTTGTIYQGSTPLKHQVKLEPSPTPLIGAPITENKISPKLAAFEPRRRGRKRGALNAAFRDRFMREQDAMAIENLKRDLNDDGDMGSPLLSSLLTKVEDGIGIKNSGDITTNKYLKEMGLQGHVPILVDNGEGKLVTLSEDLLKSVMEADSQLSLHNDALSKLKKSPNRSPFIVKGLTSDRLDDEDPDLSLTDCKGEEPEVLDEEMIQTLRNGAASEAENEPEAVVLFEVTDNKKVEKYVVSAKEVSLLKALNETLTKQKKELADITKNSNLNTIDVAGSNAKVTELKLKIGRTKSILSQVVGYAQGMKDKLKTALSAADKDNNSKKSQMVQLEFIDGNGEKIEGYQVTGTLVDKKESKDEFMGLFDMVCDTTSQNPLLGGESAVEKEKLEVENSYQLEDNTETISYQIEAMMNDSSNNIVIEDKSQDFKYIMDNDGNIMNQEEHYVVYESENVIYDGGLGGEDSSQAIHEDDGAEYVVYSEDSASKNVAEDARDYMSYDDGPTKDPDFVVYPPVDDMSSDKVPEDPPDDSVFPTEDSGHVTFGHDDDLDAVHPPSPRGPLSPINKRVVELSTDLTSPEKKAKLTHNL
uniref:Protein bric-a-brac 2 n=1 Tax=Lygus hesperus TaxID=30085 RepID=A0A146L6M3_LYGHE